MAAGVPPPPLNSPSGSYYWLEWYTNLTNFLNGTNIPWSNLNFTGSNITDIMTRNHNDLQTIQGGDVTGSPGKAFHMIGAQYIGQVASAGTAVFLPTGWTVAGTGGVYTVTHSLGLTTHYVVSVTQTNAATLTSVITTSNAFTVTYSTACGFTFVFNQGS